MQRVFMTLVFSFMLGTLASLASAERICEAAEVHRHDSVYYGCILSENKKWITFATSFDLGSKDKDLTFKFKKKEVTVTRLSQAKGAEPLRGPGSCIVSSVGWVDAVAYLYSDLFPPEEFKRVFRETHNSLSLGCVEKTERGLLVNMTFRNKKPRDRIFIPFEPDLTPLPLKVGPPTN